MSAISATAVSGVQAAATRMDVAAHNVANAQTPGFHRQEVHLRSQETAGVVSSVGQAQEVGPDLAADLIEQKSASYQYKANLKTIQTETQMMGSLLDLKA
jgi:flagellar hook protein FlgE